MRTPRVLPAFLGEDSLFASALWRSTISGLLREVGDQTPLQGPSPATSNFTERESDQETFGDFKVRERMNAPEPCQNSPSSAFVGSLGRFILYQDK